MNNLFIGGSLILQKTYSSKFKVGDEVSLTALAKSQDSYIVGLKALDGTKLTVNIPKEDMKLWEQESPQLTSNALVNEILIEGRASLLNE